MCALDDEIKRLKPVEGHAKIESASCHKFLNWGAKVWHTPQPSSYKKVDSMDHSVWGPSRSGELAGCRVTES